MRAFKTKPFARFAAKEGIADVVLRDAIGRAEAGLVDADLGGGVIKQRLAQDRANRVAFAASCCSGGKPWRSSSTASRRTIGTTSTGRN
jgi:hypothetical protein